MRAGCGGDPWPRRYRRLAALCFAVLALGVAALSPPHAVAAGEYRELNVGATGEDVTALKSRLFELGYYLTTKVSKAYNEDTARKVGEFQKRNGMEPTGIATLETQALLFSKEATPQPLPTSVPWPGTEPTSGPSKWLWFPGVGPEGFLSNPKANPIIHSDDQDGRWIYVGASLRVDIKRFRRADVPLEWYEVDIRVAPGTLPRALLSAKGGTRFELPLNLAQEAGAVFAITDDFFGYRTVNKKRVGIVLRDGKILSERTYEQDRSRIPSLEVLALHADGTLKTYDSDAHTGEEYLQMGVTDTWAFGPVLVRDGEVPRYYYSEDYRSYREPRCAFGMAEPGHYLALVVTGRRTSSKGAYFGWMAEKMKRMGAVEALNLDGGNTVALVFMDRVLNKYDGRNQESNRKVSGVIAFCDSGAP